MFDLGLEDYQNRKRRRRRRPSGNNNETTSRPVRVDLGELLIIRNYSNDEESSCALLATKNKLIVCDDTQIDLNEQRNKSCEDRARQMRTPTNRQARHKHQTMNCFTNFKLLPVKHFGANTLAALILLCLIDSLAGQRAAPPMMSGSSETPMGLQFQDLPAEARGEHVMRQPSSTIEMLTNLLNAYQQPAMNRGSPLGQRSPQVSTPVNPFSAQFQPNSLGSRRNQMLPPQASGNSNNNPANFQRMNGANMNPMLMASSSPPTPYLTLNRLSNIANQQQANTNNNRPPINIQPLNTIPLGSLGNNNNNNQQFGGRAPAISLMPPRGMAPASRGPMQQSGSQVRPMASVPLPPSSGIQAPMANPVKPISGGFAPSGPPPSQAANGSNNAMVVVQSPPNAIGTTQSAPINVSAASEEPVATERQQQATTTTSAAPTTVAATTAPAANEKAPATTATPESSSLPARTTISSPMTPISIEVNSEQSSSWSPVDVSNKSNSSGGESKTRVSLAPSPDIVTVPPNYDPDAPAKNQPEIYDIAVSTKMGGSKQADDQQSSSSSVNPTPNLATVAINNGPEASSTLTIDVTTTATSSSAIPTVAPTAVTTIIWSPPPSDLPSPSSPASIQPTRTLDYGARFQQTTSAATSPAPVTSTPLPPPPPPPPPSRIRDNSMTNDDPFAGQNTENQGVVYGKPQTRDSKPTAPPSADGQALPGRSIIKPAPLDSQVRPFAAGSQQSLHKSSHHGHQSPLFKPTKPLSGNNQSPMNVGSGFTITANGNQTMPTGDIQDYAANQPPPTVGLAPPGSQISGSFQVSGDAQEPTISAQGGQDPASFDLSAQDTSASVARSPTANSSTSPAPRIKRPTFKPKPVEPLIRIDSCIVGDESSCEQAHNERCITEYGISSCHCKPGYARLTPVRGFCSPVSALQMTMKIDKLSDDRRLAYNHTLENPNTEEYQYMEFETIQSLLGLFQQTGLFDQYLGSRVNKFFEHKGKVYANVTLNLLANNVTKTNKISQVVSQEISKVMKPQKSFGDSMIMFDGTKESASKLTDINECANPELNDCSKQATCTNDFGGFHCQCLPGYEDKHANKERGKQGRICLGCSASYCSNRGECSIVDGQKQCKCRPNFIGSRCDIDSEVMAVAIGGSLVGVIILIVTFWCLFIFNRRWKREQQKMDAMSATSGLTFNYVNSSTNSLISPARIVGGLHRAGGHHAVGTMANNYTQRFGVALAGAGGRGGQHYAPDQQAIMGSTSSGSSAASQPIGCSHYAPGYQYEDAGLLIAPASAGSSEQTSPSGNSIREYALNQLTGTAYTLSGHHHHNHNHSHHHHQQQLAKSHMLPLTQFHPAAAGADYRTMNTTMQHCPSTTANHHYLDGANRWRTLQQESSGKALVGYYLSPDMLVNHQQQQQQLYASPQRELCIDTEGNQVAGRSRRQQGRSAQTLRSRSQGPRPNGGQQARNSVYSGHYEHERPI